MIKTVINKSITTIMFYMAIVLVGLLAVCNIPKDLYPEMKIPYVVVFSSYNGAGPSEIQSLVTKPLEESLGTVSDLKKMTSTSGNGTSVIVLEFYDSINMDFAALNVREKVDMVKNALPSSVTAPTIMKINPTQQAIYSVAVYSDKLDVVKLNTLLEDAIKPELEKINGVAQVALAGGKEREIKVITYPEKMQVFGITNDMVSQTLASENLNLPGGNLLEGRKDITIRTIGEFKTIEDIKNIPIETKAGTVYVRDIADVKDDYKKLSTRAYVDGKEAIQISVQKQSVANTVKVCEKVDKRLEELAKEYDGIIETKVVFNSADYINSAINSVASSALVGGILAVIILYIFLRNIWPTLVIATSIPTSILATFMLMYMTGMTLNMITLSSLTIAIGMLVDASIVVLENIDVHKAKGKGPKDAAYDGAKEVMVAVFASTLTSVVVFLPFVFTTGMIMQMLHVFAWVVMFALFASIVTALTLVPMLSSKLPEKPKVLKNKIAKKLVHLFAIWLEKLEALYAEVLEYAVYHKKKIVKIVGIIVLISLVCLVFTKKELMPESDQGSYTVSIKLPEGTNLENNYELTCEVAERIKALKETDYILMVVGSGSMLSSGESNSSELTVDIGKSSKRNYTIDQAVSKARKAISDIPGAEFELSTASSQSMSSGGADVALTLTGDDETKLHQIADELVTRFSDIDGICEVKKGITKGAREARVEIDRTKLSAYGLSTGQVAKSIQTAISGTKATSIKLAGDEVDITISTDDTSVKYVKDLSNIFVTSPTTGISIPLTEVGNIVIDNAPSVIERTNQKQTLNVEAKLDGIALGDAQTKIEDSLKGYVMPDGYTYSWGGDMEMMISAFKNLIIAIVAAVILVYMVMASQFESLFNPFIIMFTIPIAFAGSFIGLFITGGSLSVVSVMGMIVLVGIVVNNGIILIDFIGQERARGTDMITATIMSGKQRLRPILMTTLTTILGMIPMALDTGDGSEMKGLAVVVIFGLLTSTLLTLVLIPVLYIYLNTKLEARRAEKKRKREIKEQWEEERELRREEKERMIELENKKNKDKK